MAEEEALELLLKTSKTVGQPGDSVRTVMTKVMDVPWTFDRDVVSTARGLFLSCFLCHLMLDVTSIGGLVFECARVVETR
ncbi:MAG: hypothetical protein AAF085_15415, partial [Planctomycetota bacterium]